MHLLQLAAVSALICGSIGIGSEPLSAAPQSTSTVITSPEPLPEADGRLRVFLGGSIEMGAARDWQSEIIEALQLAPVVLLNPRRADWDPAWLPSADNPEFRRQVEWELHALDNADIIVMYLAPGTKSPVSLMELGLHAQSDKVILYCPDGFWRKGNVDITAEYYDIEQVSSIDELISAVRARVAHSDGAD